MAIDTGSSEIAGPQHVIDHLSDKYHGWRSILIASKDGNERGLGAWGGSSGLGAWGEYDD